MQQTYKYIRPIPAKYNITLYTLFIKIITSKMHLLKVVYNIHTRLQPLLITLSYRFTVITYYLVTHSVKKSLQLLVSSEDLVLEDYP